MKERNLEQTLLEGGGTYSMIRGFDVGVEQASSKEDKNKKIYSVYVIDNTRVKPKKKKGKDGETKYSHINVLIREVEDIPIALAMHGSLLALFNGEEYSGFKEETDKVAKYLRKHR